MTKEEITRINELARKSKAEGLTDEEREEQQELRRRYIQSIRSDLRATLQNITIVDENNEEEKPEQNSLS